MGDKENPFFRGRGIHVTGDFQIESFSLIFDRTTGELAEQPPPLQTKVRTHTWHHWLIASQEACEACASAREAMKGVDDATFATLLEREFRSGMQAVCATAFAVDAFYASVVELAPTARVEASGRVKRIFSTLSRAFIMTNPQQ